MATNTKDAAEARFKKPPKADREGSNASTEYEAEVQANREKTVRLKALRLAKEAADLEAKAKAKPAPRKKKVSSV